jgi:membrane associated rhomboid family serine protease
VATRTLFCPECGLIELAAGSDRCPSCALTALDDADPANRDAIAEAIELRRQLLLPRWAFAIVLGGFGIGLLVGSTMFSDLGVGQLFAYAFAIAGAVVASRLAERRLTPAWRAAIEHADAASGDRELRHRLRTGMTNVVALVLVVFTAVQLAVGTEHVTYARGDALWRIFTSCLAHGGAVHLIGNLIGLYLFGRVIDLRVGRRGMVAILAVSALTGTVAQAAYSPEPMLGFSGAVFGLVGATLALMPNRPELLMVQGISIPMPTWLWSVLWMGLVTLLAWVDLRGHIAWVAHLGGFAGGFAVALPMRRLTPTPTFERYERRRRDRLQRLASR